MSSVAVVSLKGSPGATTLSMALASAWATREPTYLAEIDPDGGELAALCDLSLDAEGLLSLTVAGRHPGAVPNALGHAQRFGPAELPVLVAPSSAEVVTDALRSFGDRVVPSLEATEHMVVVDAGRLRGDSTNVPVLRAADVAVLVVRPTLAQAELLSSRLAAIQSMNDNVAVVLIGDRPYSAAEFSSAVGAEVDAVIPVDNRGVEAMFTSPGSFFERRSRLASAASQLVDHLQHRFFAHAEVTR